MRTRLHVVLTVALCVVMTGCGFLSMLDTDSLALRGVVRITVGRVLSANPKFVEPTYVLMDQAIAASTGGEVVSIDALRLYVEERIPFHVLTPEETEMIGFVMVEVVSALRTHFESQGVVDAREQVLRAVTVLTWIKQSAEWRMVKP